MNSEHQHIKGLFLVIITSILCISNNYVYSQGSMDSTLTDSHTLEYLKSIYGLDPQLHNGKPYNYFKQSNILGNQFLVDEPFTKGELTIRGIKFTNIYLNYDLYEQEVLLKYHNSNGYASILKISKAWLEEFSIGKSNFKFIALNGFPEKKIYQVIGLHTDSIQIYYFIKKELLFNNEYGKSNYTFTPKRSSYLLINGVLHPYSNNKTFIKSFDKNTQSLLKKYLRNNKINVKKSTDATMEQLINYCNSL